MFKRIEGKNNAWETSYIWLVSQALLPIVEVSQSTSIYRNTEPCKFLDGGGFIHVRIQSKIPRICDEQLLESLDEN